MDEPEVDGSSDSPTRHRQADLLRELASRLEAGDPPLPTDVFSTVEGQLHLRLDDEAIDEACAEQADREGEPWVYCRSRV